AADERIEFMPSAAQAHIVPAHRKIYQPRFAAQLSSKRHPVSSPIVVVPEGEETATGVISESNSTVSITSLRVENWTDRRLVISGALSAEVAPEQKIARPILESSAAPAERIGRSSAASQIAAQTALRTVRIIETTADGVDDAADRIGPVEESGRATHDLYSIDR